jgi:hypothetical protein
MSSDPNKPTLKILLIREPERASGSVYGPTFEVVFELWPGSTYSVFLNRDVVPDAEIVAAARKAFYDQVSRLAKETESWGAARG